MELNGISAIVTGGASGLGEATARLLAERGAKVVVADMNAEKGEAVASDIGGAFATTDVADPDQVIATIEAAKEMGPLRAVVNAAGIGWATRTIGKDGEYSSAHDLDIFKKVIEVNLVGSFNVIRLAATAMSQLDAADEHGERGAIVNVASVAAFDGQIGQASYSASKGGVVGMTLPIARDLSAVGIRVELHRPRPHRHAHLRHRRGLRAVQGPAQGRRAVPEAPRHLRGVRHPGPRAALQQLPQRRDRPHRRRHPHAAQVSPAPVRRLRSRPTAPVPARGGGAPRPRQAAGRSSRWRKVASRSVWPKAKPASRSAAGRTRALEKRRSPAAGRCRGGGGW